MGDFAILLRAGFDRWTAAKLQFSTALGGLLGACFAICTQSPKGVGTRVVNSGAKGHLCPAAIGVVSAWCPVQVGEVHSALSSLPVDPPYRGDGGVDPALHLWRLSLYCPGECAA